MIYIRDHQYFSNLLVVCFPIMRTCCDLLFHLDWRDRYSFYSMESELEIIKYSLSAMPADVNTAIGEEHSSFWAYYKMIKLTIINFVLI